MLIIKSIINYQIKIELITIISSSNTINKSIIRIIQLPSMIKKIKMNNKLKNKLIQYQNIAEE